MVWSHAKNRRVVVLKEEIDRDSIFKAKYLIERIVKIDNGDTSKPITIRINSYGGEALSTMFLAGYIEELKEIGYTIITECEAFAMSGGFLILIAGSERIAHRYSEIMTHQPNSFMQGVYTFKDKKIEVEQTSKLWENLIEYTVKNTKITREQLEQTVLRNEDWFMDSQEALRLGVIDKIV